MGLFSLASSMGIFESDLKSLLNGRASFGVASKLGVFESDLQKFLNGKASYSMANRMGTFESDLQPMLTNMGKEATIGIIVGMLIPKK